MIVFRADGNSNIGAGHIMRCLSIAKAAPAAEHILFLTADGSFTQTLRSAGVRNRILHTDYRNLSSEANQMKDFIHTYHPSILFIDSYYVTGPYLSALQDSCRTAGCTLVYIDDLLAFPYPCALLVNYNIYGPDKLPVYQQMYREAGEHEPQYLLGPDYAPLRPEFRNLPVRRVREKASDILVSTGGSDPEHLTLQLVRQVMDRSLPYTFHFVIGVMNEDREAVTELVSKKQAGNVVLHHNVTEMTALMQKMDLAVSAAGSTLYELCAAQIPAVTYILADNQIPGAEGFRKHRVLNCAGDYRTEPDLARKLIDAAVRLAENSQERKQIAEKMRMVVDGNGAGRILEAAL